MSDDKKTEAIEWSRGIHRVRLEVRSYATEHGEPATPADLAAAGYISLDEADASKAAAEAEWSRSESAWADRAIAAERQLAEVTAERDRARAELGEICVAATVRPGETWMGRASASCDAVSSILNERDMLDSKLAEVTAKLKAAEAEAMGLRCSNGYELVEELTAKLKAAEGRANSWEIEARSLAADVIRAEEHGRLGDRDRSMVSAARRLKGTPASPPSPAQAEPIQAKCAYLPCQNRPLPGSRRCYDHQPERCPQPQQPVHVHDLKTTRLGCWCLRCKPQPGVTRTMVVCLVCYNKRCPKAEWHGFACTGSNEPGQVGTPEPASLPSPPAAHGTPLTVEMMVKALRELGTDETFDDLADELERAQKGDG
jgi:hypothetical protein